MLDLNNIIVKCTGQYDKHVVCRIYGLANTPVGETIYPAGHPHAGTYFGGTGGPFGIAGIDELIWGSGVAPKTATFLYINKNTCDIRFWSDGDPQLSDEWVLIFRRDVSYQPEITDVKTVPTDYMPNAGEKCLASWLVDQYESKTDYREVVFAASFKGNVWLVDGDEHFHMPLGYVDFRPLPSAKKDFVRQVQTIVSDHIGHCNGMKASQAEILAGELFENDFRQVEPLSYQKLLNLTGEGPINHRVVFELLRDGRFINAEGK